MERMFQLKHGTLRMFAHSPPFFEMLTVLLAAAWCIINALGKV